MDSSDEEIKKIEELADCDDLFDDLDLTDLDFISDDIFDELTSHDKNETIHDECDDDEEGVEFEPN